MDTPVGWNSSTREDSNDFGTLSFVTPSNVVGRLLKCSQKSKNNKMKSENGQINDQLLEIKKILEEEKKLDWQRTPFEDIINGVSWSWS
uniref:Ovule protein n=1 Tax=Strongyloides stercoralis TaxID=6248 RepID=A0A0K0E312_STRER